MNLAHWTEKAKQAQAQIRAKANKPRRQRQTFIIFSRDLPKLKRALGPRLSAMIHIDQEIMLGNDYCGSQ